MGCVDGCGAHYTTALPPLPTSWEKLLAQVAYTILCSYTFLYETKGNKWKKKFNSLAKSGIERQILSP